MKNKPINWVVPGVFIGAVIASKFIAHRQVAYAVAGITLLYFVGLALYFFWWKEKEYKRWYSDVVIGRKTFRQEGFRRMSIGITKRPVSGFKNLEFTTYKDTRIMDTYYADYLKEDEDMYVFQESYEDAAKDNRAPKRYYVDYDKVIDVTNKITYRKNLSDEV